MAFYTLWLLTVIINLTEPDQNFTKDNGSLKVFLPCPDSCHCTRFQPFIAGHNDSLYRNYYENQLFLNVNCDRTNITLPLLAARFNFLPNFRRNFSDPTLPSLPSSILPSSLPTSSSTSSSSSSSSSSSTSTVYVKSL